MRGSAFSRQACHNPRQRPDEDGPPFLPHGENEFKDFGEHKEFKEFKERVRADGNGVTAGAAGGGGTAAAGAAPRGAAGDKSGTAAALLLPPLPAPPLRAPFSDSKAQRLAEATPTAEDHLRRLEAAALSTAAARNATVGGEHKEPATSKSRDRGRKRGSHCTCGRCPDYHYYEEDALGLAGDDDIVGVGGAVSVRGYGRDSEPAAQPSSWSCGACTLINSGRDAECRVCGSLVPGGWLCDCR
jgi:hypothetical protein